MRFYLRVLSYFREDACKLAMLGVLIVAQTLVGLLQACPLAVLLDDVLSPTPKADWMHRLLMAPLPSSRFGQILGLAGITMLLRFAQELVGTVRTYWGRAIGLGGVLRARSHLFEKLQALSLSFHQSVPQGDLIQRVWDDAGGLQALLDAFISVAVSLFTLLVMTCIMLALDLRLTVLALGIAPLLIATNVHFGRLFRRRCDDAKVAQSAALAAVQRIIQTMSLAQAFCREGDELTRFNARARGSVRAWLRLHKDEVYYLLVVGAIFGVGAGSIFGYGSMLVLRGQAAGANSGMTVGALTIFLAYLGMLYDPLCKLSGAAASVQAGAAGARRVFELVDHVSAITDSPGATSLPVRPRVIELADVAFAYEPGRHVFTGASARINPGEMVAFVGSSGAGKSTLLNLLPRFYDPTSGTITLDGHDLRRVKIKDLRRHVALVSQDAPLVPATIAENIAYGRPDATMEAIRAAADLAGAARFIDELPRGYATLLEEAGQRLSGGQRQRVALARALLTEAPILVLDEPTSALDLEHEREIISALSAMKGKRTIVLISHRLASVSACDQIFVLEDGRIAERGGYEELLARRGVFHRLARFEPA